MRATGGGYLREGINNPCFPTSKRISVLYSLPQREVELQQATSHWDERKSGGRKSPCQPFFVSALMWQQVADLHPVRHLCLDVHRKLHILKLFCMNAYRSMWQHPQRREEARDKTQAPISALFPSLSLKTVVNILPDSCHRCKHKASGVDQDSSTDRLHE